MTGSRASVPEAGPGAPHASAGEGRPARAADGAAPELKAAYIYLDAAEQVRRDTVPRAQALLTRLSTTNKPLAASLLERHACTTRASALGAPEKQRKVAQLLEPKS